MKASTSNLLLLLRLALLIVGATTSLSAQMPHAIQPSSFERQAICDAMGLWCRPNTLISPAQPVVFKIDTLRVQGGFACLECLPLFSDVPDAVPQYRPDIGYMHCLQRGPKGWKVILDLSRADDPDTTEVRQIPKRLPLIFPDQISFRSNQTPLPS